MQLKTLTITNIASYDNVTIDFTAEPLASAPVILISGDVGSGKTTILDAITLALYAKAPRMQSTDMTTMPPTDKRNTVIAPNDVRQLIRRGQTHAMAQLTFIAGDRQQYTATWQASITRNKTYNPVSHTLTLPDGTIITQTRQTQQYLTQLISLDYDQFCRTTMLPQGQFTQFLKARDNEKARILEKITSRDIFSRISQEIHTRTAQKKQTLDVLDTQIATLTKRMEDSDGANVDTAALAVQISQLKQQAANLTSLRQTISETLNYKQQTITLTQEAQHTAAVLREALAATRTPQYTADRRLCVDYDTTATVRDDIIALRAARKRLAEQQRLLPTLCQSYASLLLNRQGLLDKITTCEQKITAITASITQAQTVVDTARATAERSQTAYDTFQGATDQWAKNMRARLHIGDTCPLCRQTIATPFPDEDSLRALADTLRENRNTDAKALQNAIHAVDILNTNLALANNNLRHLRDDLVALTDNLDEIAQKLPTITQKNDETTVTTNNDTTGATLLGQVRQYIQVLHDDTHTITTLEKAISSRLDTLPDIDLARATVLADTPHATIVAARRRLDIADKTLALADHNDKTARDKLNHHRDNPPHDTALVDLTVDELTQKLTDTTALHDQALSDLGRLTQIQNNHIRDIEELKKLNAKRSDADKQYLAWSTLDTNLGSASGDKFRRIAQSFILQTLLNAANTYLRRLTPRYTLVTQPGTLNIDIIDHSEPGNPPRSANTASGGETFMISLALALALCQINPDNPVDTLFIDEGFGTLSGTPLDNAVTLLRSLHRISGRRVAVISHIEQLKNHIPTQIQVATDPRTAAARLSIISL